MSQNVLIVITLNFIFSATSGGSADRPFSQYSHSTPGSTSNHSSQHYPPYDYHNHGAHMPYPMGYHPQPPPGYPPGLPSTQGQWQPHWPPPVPDTRVVNAAPLPPSNEIHQWPGYPAPPEARNSIVGKVCKCWSNFRFLFVMFFYSLKWFSQTLLFFSVKEERKVS